MEYSELRNGFALLRAVKHRIPEIREELKSLETFVNQLELFMNKLDADTLLNKTRDEYSYENEDNKEHP